MQRKFLHDRLPIPTASCDALVARARSMLGGGRTGFNDQLDLHRPALRFACMASLYRLQIRPPLPLSWCYCPHPSQPSSDVVRPFLLRSAIATPRAPSDRTSELGRPCRRRLPRIVSHLGLCGMPRARESAPRRTSSTVASHPPPPAGCNCGFGVQLHVSDRG